MIYRARTVTVVQEKAKEARSLLVRGAAYASEHYAGIQVEILENVAGSWRELHMVTRCESLAALERYEADRFDDAGWLAWIAEAEAFQGTVGAVDHLYRLVE